MAGWGDCTLRSFVVCTYEQIMDDEMGGTCSAYGVTKNAYTILVGNPEGKRPFGKPTRSGEDNIKVDLKEITLESADCIYLTEDGVQCRSCEHGNRPYSLNGEEFLDQLCILLGSLPRWAVLHGVS
jgi:hypothetical protein